MDRRELLRLLAAAAALQGLGAAAPGELLALGRRVHERGPSSQGSSALDTHARRTVELAAERIIPATDTPGATEANVAAFVDHMLAGWYPADDRDRFLAGLRELDARCRALRGRTFVECAEADQVSVLTSLDGEVTALRQASGAAAAGAHWFAMLKWLTVYGYCTSEVAMRRTLGAWPMPGRYDGCAPVAPPRAEG